MAARQHHQVMELNTPGEDINIVLDRKNPVSYSKVRLVGKSITIDTAAFQGSEWLKTVSLTATNQIVIADSAFKNCANLTDLSFSGETITINSYSFENTAIKNLHVPCPGVICEGAFKKCSQLSTIALSDKTALHLRAFGNCSRLQYFVVPDSLMAVFTNGTFTYQRMLSASLAPFGEPKNAFRQIALCMTQTVLFKFCSGLRNNNYTLEQINAVKSKVQAVDSVLVTLNLWLGYGTKITNLINRYKPEITNLLNLPNNEKETMFDNIANDVFTQKIPNIDHLVRQYAAKSVSHHLKQVNLSHIDNTASAAARISIVLCALDWNATRNAQTHNIVVSTSDGTSLLEMSIKTGRDLYLQLNSFFYPIGRVPSEERDYVVENGRTVAGIGMELVALFAIKEGATRVELTDAWTSGNGTGSSQLMAMANRASLDKNSMEHTRFVRRANEYGLYDDGQIEEYIKKTGNSGFYGVWGFKRDPDSGFEISKSVLVKNMVTTRETFT